MSATTDHGRRGTAARSATALLAERPELRAGLELLLGQVHDGRVDTLILDLSRRRVGTLLGCPVHAGEMPERLSPAQQACIDFTEQFVIDVHGIDDATSARVTEALEPAGMVAFTTALALYDGFCRFERVTAAPDIDPDIDSDGA